ncbi:MAG: DUF3047 domain-containing protein [Deltaproteobacteria bacterium]|nr:DUF3047 domain-containing protein [Deltaproteobacteria bacterium]
MPWHHAITTLGLILALHTVVMADEISVSRLDSSESLAGWESRSFKGLTEYRLVQEEGSTVIKATSTNAASGLIKRIRFSPLKYRYLRWSWKISHTIQGGDEMSRSGDDYAARVYVIFPGRFFWQTRAINYIWANRLAKGASVPNAYSANAMMIAVETGNGLAGKWQAEQRDLIADYRLLFGEEPPEAEAIAIMTDTDNTGGSAEAWYGEITIASEGR